MSEVALQIGGRTYRVACAPGEEERVRKLGATIDEKLVALGNPTGPDAQNLLFAALLLADEALESRETAGKSGDGGAERARLQTALADLEAQGEKAQAEIGNLKNALAEQEAEAVRLRGAIADLEAERDARPVPEGAARPADLGALAPALEHFAEMLEDCADKLERRAPAA